MRSFLPMVMAALQGLWLGSIWLSGAAAHWQKLPLLLIYSGACVLVIVRLPDSIVHRIRHGTDRLTHQEGRLTILLSATVVSIGGVYAYVQSGWPDEPSVFAAARIIAEQGVTTFFAHYAQIPWLGTQHPPLALLVYGAALSLFGVHLLVIRLVSLGLSVATLLLTYRLASRLYDRRTGLLAAGCLLAAPFFFRIGTSALSDMPVTFCFVWAVSILLALLETPTYRRAVGLGLCIGAGLLCRYTMVFFYLLLGSYGLMVAASRRLLPQLILATLISASILALWLGYAAHLGVLAGQWEKITEYAGFLMVADTGKEWLLGSLLFRVPSGLGPYNLPLLFLGGWQMMRHRGQADWYVLLWIAAVFVPLMLTLPGPRYFLPAFPALAIVMARGLEEVSEKKEQLLLLAWLYGGGALYLFVDWERAAGTLFVH